MQSVFFLLAVLGCIGVVSANQCYACDDIIGEKCGDPFDSTSKGDGDKKDLPSGGVCTKVKIQKDGKVVISRDASDLTASCLGGKNGCKEHTEDGQSVTICCCTSNLCNGVSTLRQPPMIIVFLTIIVFVMFIYRQ